ncbi:hypothetical protein Tco_1081153 [Tanacetum coccineum]|uniref:Reverse transcriptase n=1 Tax=Tanacetum coccineum TaxID=301880 RepID=A0ABQ5HWU0_9ASTR
MLRMKMEDVLDFNNGTTEVMGNNEINGIEGKELERKSLWEELVKESRYVNGKPWCIAGYMNVTLKPNEHSCGSSDPSQKVETDIDNDPHNHILRDIEAKLVKEFYEAEEDEEKFLFQQTKIKWLSDGDKNNSYFHKVLKGRNNRSKILSLNDDSGISYDSEQIPQLFFKHFEDFFGRSHLVQHIEDCGTLFHKRVSEEDALRIIVDVSDNQIKKAMFDIDDSKAPGPNGFTAAFKKSMGDSNSVRVIKRALDEFNACSELLANNLKSTVFFGNLCEEERDAITNVPPFAIRKLLVRYLGVPLIAKRLSVKDCGNLLDRIKSESNIGHLFQIISHKDLYDARLKDDMNVSEMINNGQWRWLEEWYEKHEHLVSSGIMVEANLVLTMYSQTLLHYAGNGSNIISVIRRIAFAASIYHIWKERNERTFREVKRYFDEVFRNIVDKVKNRLLGLIVKDSSAVREIERKWAISCNKISLKKLQ